MINYSQRSRASLACLKIVCYTKQSFEKQNVTPKVCFQKGKDRITALLLLDGEVLAAARAIRLRNASRRRVLKRT